MDRLLIVGLGNPGREYRETRHNAGFMLADRLTARWRLAWRSEPKFFAELAEGAVNGRRLVLSKPQTFMNASGEAVGKLAAYLRVPASAVLVLVDDADLPLGTLRLRPAGSAGGHHGLESVTQHLGSREFPRLKLGVARPAQAVRDIAGHVLGGFRPDERELWERVLGRAAEQVDTWVQDGPGKAMNLYNGPVK
jgi:peptidyl-tRNA hydrolase, PTH1 family